MRLRPLLINLSLAAGALLFTALLLEGALRLTGIGAEEGGTSTLLTRHDSLLGWSKIPNGEVTHETREYTVVERTNSLGLRGPEIPPEKPDGGQRVLLLGDSFLEGYTVSEADLVSTQLQRRLEERRSTGPVEVINGGTAGYATDQELLFFRRDGRTFAPDVTVLMFYVNDVWFNTQDRYWRGHKPRFEWDGDSLRLRNVPVPAPDDEAFAFAVEGGRGFTGWLRRGDAWMGAHSRLYFLVRSGILQTPMVRGFLTRRGVVDVPGEWLPWSRDADRGLADAWALTEVLIEQLRQEALAAGSEFLVFYIPSRPAVDPADWRRTRTAYAMDEASWSPEQDASVLRAICARREWRCTIPVDRFRDAARAGQTLYFAADAHWTPAGHALAADLLAEAVAPLLDR